MLTTRTSDEQAAVSLQKRMNSRLVRYTELRPGTVAFVDAKNPGSHLKDNFCIIGAGVAENPLQPVHIKETAGFNIGGAGQPPGIINSLHSHRSAEIFIVFRGKFRFYWGNQGQDEAILSPGDLISIPTNLFRGFEVVGRNYGFMFSVLGGDRAGGGVIWHPKVIEEGRKNGLYLLKSGSLIDTAEHPVPAEEELLTPLSAAQMDTFDHYSAAEMGRRFVAWKKNYRQVTRELPGGHYRQFALSGHPQSSRDFQVKSIDGVSVHAYQIEEGQGVPWHYRAEKQVLINFEGDTLVELQQHGAQGQLVLTPGDVFDVEQGAAVRLQALRGQSLSYLVLGSDLPTVATCR